MPIGVIVVGGGHAGGSTAIALRRRGYAGPITLLGDEQTPPYNRPPLSKTFMKSTELANTLLLRPSEFWDTQRIDVRTGIEVTSIDRAGKTIGTSTGQRLPYEHLILATGARLRRIESIIGSVGLRTWQDADTIRTALRAGSRIAIVGGGFIGLEIASTARSMGADVTIIEAAPRLLMRALSAEAANFLLAQHRAHGVAVHIGTGVAEAQRDLLVLENGARVEYGLVVVGIGVTPHVELAEAAGLAVEDGVLVDEHLRTSDPHIWAVGDCARHLNAANGRPLRLESIQNATDHADHVATQIVTGELTPYASVPWFWTEQYGRKILIAGVASPDDRSVIRGDLEAGEFSICRVDEQDHLVAVESFNRVEDHIAARKLLARNTDGGVDVGALDLTDLSRSLLQLAEQATENRPA